MRRQTRKLLVRIATAVALALTTAMVLLPGTALAAPATVNTNANVRAVPNGRVVDILQRGETVDLRGCSGGWCELSRGGFVSESLLSRRGGGGGGSDVGVGISIGPGGISVGIGNGNNNGNRPRPPVIEEEFGEVCFFERSRFRGDSFCMESGDSMPRLRSWDDRIGSIRNPDDLHVTVCARERFRDCRTYRSSARSLDDFDGEISSIRVR
jgi:hypothetical protein